MTCHDKVILRVKGLGSCCIPLRRHDRGHQRLPVRDSPQALQHLAMLPGSDGRLFPGQRSASAAAFGAFRAFFDVFFMIFGSKRHVSVVFSDVFGRF